MAEIALFPFHPSQIWVMLPVAEGLQAKGHGVLWIIRDKDCSVELAERLGLSYVRLTRAARSMGGTAVEFAEATWRAWRAGSKHGIDLWFTKGGPGNLAGLLARRGSVSFNDDDADVVPFVARTSYPFAKAVLVTHVTRMGKYERKAIRFPGYVELCYLHPTRFTPDPSIHDDLGLSRDEPFAVVRLSALQAHHDVGVRGISGELLREVIARLGSIRPYITSEKPLDREFEPYRLPIAPHRIHHALAHAEFTISDSQTMTSESAVLGTPSLRINSFVGRISYLRDLEERGLSFGFLPGNEDALVRQLGELVAMPDRRKVFAQRRAAMLEDCIDPAPFIVDALDGFAKGASFGEVAKQLHGKYLESPS